jgi:cell division protease FtsH
VLVLALLAIWVASFAWSGRRGGSSGSTKDADLSTLIRRAKTRPGTIERVVFVPGSQSIEATLRSGTRLDAHYATPQAQISFQQLLERQNVDFASQAPPSGGGGLGGLVAVAVSWLLPLLLLAAVWWFLLRRLRSGAGGGAGQLLGFGRSKARRIAPAHPAVTYADVAGADEAVEELRELKEFLAEPRRFRALGGRIPKGVLLYGPPGTGKTLLARATAGEAGVPFYSISGSDFVEMFVGVGASRVRDLFERARAEPAAIVFIDELDAVGRQRGAGLGGGHDEREHTLNQLLVAMDGFDASENVVVIAATNRPDVLDPALLRPGRFDRQIAVDRPDRGGRRRILEVHARGKPFAADVDLDRLAATSPGFTGADLANLLNEAALLAARRGETTIGQSALEEATLRVVAGPEKRSRVLSERERTVASYHEVGHAFVGELLEHAERPQKISIIGRGRALGFTLSLPAEESMLAVCSELLDRMAMTLGGRAAEELVFDEVSTGAMNDLEKVTSTATAMVTRYGMSDLLGPRIVSPPSEQPFLGRQLQGGAEHSEELTREVDREVRRVIDEAHARALDVLRDHLDDLHRVAAVLVEEETIDRDRFEQLLAEAHDPAADGRPPRPAQAPLSRGVERDGPGSRSA